MAFYLSLLEGPTPAQAVSVFATGDTKILKEVRRIIFERMDELDDEPDVPPLSIAPMRAVKRGKPQAREAVEAGDGERPQP